MRLKCLFFFLLIYKNKFSKLIERKNVKNIESKFLLFYNFHNFKF